MADLIVHGGTPLRGQIVPSANKNAVLPILCATLLTREPVRLRGITEITDVKKIVEIFRLLGSEVAVDYASGILDVHHQDTHFDPATHHLLKRGIALRCSALRSVDSLMPTSLATSEGRLP